MTTEDDAPAWAQDKNHPVVKALRLLWDRHDWNSGDYDDDPVVKTLKEFSPSPTVETVNGEMDEDTVLRLMRQELPSAVIKEMTVTLWKDGIDIDRPAFSTMEFVKAVIARASAPAGADGKALRHSVNTPAG